MGQALLRIAWHPADLNNLGFSGSSREALEPECRASFGKLAKGVQILGAD